MNWVILIKVSTTVFITVREKRLVECGFSLRTSQKFQRRDFQIFTLFPRSVVPQTGVVLTSA